MDSYSLYMVRPVINKEPLLTKLETLDWNKGTGPDGIPPRFITFFII